MLVLVLAIVLALRQQQSLVALGSWLLTSRVQRPRVARVACRRTCLASGLSRATEQPPVVVLLRHEAVLHEAPVERALAQRSPNDDIPVAELVDHFLHRFLAREFKGS